MQLTRGSLFIGLILLLALSIQSAPAAWKPEAYSEYVTLDENKGSSLEANARLVYRGKSVIEPYAGFSYLHYSAYRSSIERKSPLIGLRWQALPFLRLFAEYRVSFDSPSRLRKKDDPRLGAVLGHWQEIAALTSKIRLASDSYGEFIYMDRYADSPMAAGWTKLLIRGTPANNLYTDGFAEAYALESRDPALGRRAQELRYGARAGWVGEKISLNAMVFRRFVTLVPAPAARYRFLFAVGGSF
jgi:hypothetical protein